MLILEPPDIVDWAEKTVILPTIGNATPGPLRLDGWQREVLRACADTRNEYAAMKCGSQLGKSLVMDLLVKFHMAVVPSGIIFAMPRLEDLKRYHRTKFLPALRSSPKLAGLVASGHRTKEELGLENIIFPGGYLRYVNAHAEASWRGLTGSVLIADELDVMPSSADAENPAQMLRQRGGSMPDSAICWVMASTPQAGKFIDGYYNDGSQGEFVVRCVACGQEFMWTFEAAYAEAGAMPCTECGATFTDQQIAAMNAGGRFDHKYPAKRKRSYHITQFASPRKRHADTLAHYDPTSPRGFWTQIMALSYETVKKSLSVAAMDDMWAAKRPGRPTITTAGVDVQKDRIEWSVIEWRRYSTRAYVRRHRIEHYGPGVSGEDAAWQKLAADTRNCRVVFCDTQGDRPDTVRRMVATHLAGRGWGCYGSKTRDDLLNPLGIVQGLGAYQQVRVGTQHAKSAIWEMASRGDLKINPEGVVRADNHWNYQQQLTSEDLIVAPDGRSEMWKLIDTSKRNEALDCMVYALAASLWPKSLAYKRWGKK